MAARVGVCPRCESVAEARTEEKLGELGRASEVSDRMVDVDAPAIA